MQLRLIKTEEGYQMALNRLDKIFHAQKGSKEQDELEILVMLIQRYEDEKVGDFPDPDPIEACLLYTSPSPRDQRGSRMPSSA